MREELELNRRHWDEATAIHARGNVYGVEDFKAGACRLHPVEVKEVGDVAGKSLLHLQCHFGVDTLSWARRGAAVTGVDFSQAAIDAARSLSRETGDPRPSSSAATSTTSAIGSMLRAPSTSCSRRTASSTGCRT